MNATSIAPGDLVTVRHPGYEIVYFARVQTTGATRNQVIPVERVKGDVTLGVTVSLPASIMERADNTPCPQCGSYRKVYRAHPIPNPTGGYSGRYDHSTRCGSCSNLLSYQND